MELSRPVVVQHYAHLTLTLVFEGQNFENAVSQEWEGRLTSNKRDTSRWDVRPTLWLLTVTSPMTLTVDSWVVTQEWNAWLTWNEKDVSR